MAQCARRFRDRIVFHDLLVIPDEEAIVPLLIGRDLMPKLNVHLCRTKRSYTRGQLVDFKINEGESSLKNEIISILFEQILVSPSFELTFWFG